MNSKAKPRLYISWEFTRYLANTLLARSRLPYISIVDGRRHSTSQFSVILRYCGLENEKIQNEWGVTLSCLVPCALCLVPCDMGKMSKQADHVILVVLSLP